MATRMTLGQLIRHYRKLLGWTQKELGRCTDVNHVYVSDVERDEKKPSMEFVTRCIQVLDWEIKRMGGKGETGLSQDEKDEIWEAYSLATGGKDRERRQDWGTAPDASTFFGREEELKTLRRWIGEDGCRLVYVYGMEGIGKTTLVAKFARTSIDKFERILWLSLRDSPPIDYILGKSIHFLSGNEHVELSESLEQNIGLFIHQLKEYRCLVILDDVDAILQEGNRAGRWRGGFEGYGHLLQSVAKTAHRSCLLLTSGERLDDLARLEGDNGPVRSVRLEGLANGAAVQILEGKNLFSTEEERRALVTRYAGHPAMLEYVRAHIREEYAGQITRFLADEISIIGGVREILDQQFARLSPMEKDLIFWLATEREPLSVDDLLDNTIQPVLKADILNALSSLHSRSWIERLSVGDTTKGIVLEYVGNRLIEIFNDEVTSGKIGWLKRVPLIRATAKEHVRKAQTSKILKPIASQLDKLGKRVAADKLKGLVTTLRETESDSPGYAAGNILNLSVHVGVDLTGWDFSHLAIWEAYLPKADLYRVNFASADFKQCVFSETGGVILSVTFSPDGETLAAAISNGEIRVRRADDGAHIRTLVGHTDWVRSVDFSPNGRLLASGAGDNTVRVWDVETGICLHILKGHSGPVRCVAFSRDGRTLASGSSDKTIRLWDVERGKYKRILGRHGDHVRYVAFSPAEHSEHVLASCGNDKKVKLWNVRSLKCLHSLDNHSDYVRCVAFSPDGRRLASGSRDGTARLWDVHSGEALHAFQHNGYVRSVDFSPDGNLLASGGDDGLISLWDVPMGQHLRYFEGHTDRVRTVVFHPNSRTLASGSDDCTIRWWDSTTGECLRTQYGYYNSAWTIAFKPHDEEILVSGDEDHTLRIWNVAQGECIQELKKHDRRVAALAFSADGCRLASGGDDQKIHVWDWPSKQCIQTLVERGHRDDVKVVAFNPSGTRLASGSADCTIRIWDVETGRCLHTLEGHTDRVIAVAFASDTGILVSGSEDTTVRLWDIKTEKSEILGKHTDRVRCAAYSPEQAIVASCGDDETIKLWYLRVGRCKELAGHTKRVRAVIFSPDGQTLVSGSDDLSVRLWNVTSEECVRTLTGHTNFIRDVAFSHGGRFVASCDDSGAIRVWETESGKLLNTLKAVPPYSGMNISGATGLDRAQRAILKALGAVEAR